MKLNILISMFCISVFITPVFTGCDRSSDAKNYPKLTVTSSSYQNEAIIPAKYTCEGENISPQFKWKDFPEKTRSFVLIMDDPDAPVGTFTHWVVYDIPGSINELPEGLKNIDTSRFKQGVNDFRNRGYGGPCPPKGHGFHRYYTRIYALDIESLGLSDGASRREVEEKMKGHILAEGTYMGKFKRE